jgi:hypothetical protein
MPVHAPPGPTTTTGPEVVIPADSGTWRSLPDAPIRGRSLFGAVWTGTEMLILGGDDPYADTKLRDAGAYNPTTRQWRRLADAPEGLDRYGVEAVWTGREAILWGGYGGGIPGVAYDLLEDSWRILPDAPVRPRTNQTLVWTGREAIVWGGIGHTEKDGAIGNLADGAAYDPASNTWRRIATSPLAPRNGHVAVWTGTEMIVWGGGSLNDEQAYLPEGAAYDPARDAWRVLPDAPIHTRSAATAVWTGTRMLVYGGVYHTASGGQPYADGAAFDPSTGKWEKLPVGPLGFREGSVSVWTGRQMIIWGGLWDPYAPGLAAAAYDPQARQWTRLPKDPLAVRYYPRMVWTGVEAIVWGGREPDASPQFADGAAYRPS